MAETTTPASGTATAGANAGTSATSPGGTSNQTSAAPSSAVAPAAAGTQPAAKAVGDGSPAAGSDSTLLGSVDGKANQDGKGGAPEGQKAATTPIEVKFPEGSQVSEPIVSEFKEVAGKFGLTQEAAQALVDLQVKANTEAGKQADEAWDKMRTDWVTEVKSDKDIGGQKFDGNIALARRAVAQFGGDKFKQFLNDFGVGDHPEMVRFMVKIGAAMAEDSSGSTTTAPAPTVTDEEAILRARYPSMYPKKD